MTKTIFSSIKSDSGAAIVVFLVALPLCLGIALGSHAPLFSGIIGGIVGGIIIGALSGSHLSVSGPAAGLTVIVAAAIDSLPSFEIFLVSIVFAGVFQILFGMLKAGVIGDFIPNSVIKGMLAAIGLLLILKQFPHLLGYNSNIVGDESFQQLNNENTFSALLNAVRQYHNVTATAIGIFSLVFLFLWERPLIRRTPLLSTIPAPLVLVIIGSMANRIIGDWLPSFVLNQDHLVTIPIANGPFGLVDFLRFPDFSGGIMNRDVWVAALTIAIVASLETLLSIEAADKLDPLRRVTPNNRELIAQGVGNISSGLIGGLPLTSVIVRSSANFQAGAATKLSAVLHGFFLLICVAFAPTLLNTIPLSTLAAVLIFTGYKLAKVKIFKEFYCKGWDQFTPFVGTIVGILITDLLIGILIGIAIGLFFVVKSNFHSSVLVVQDRGRHLVRLRKDVSFLNKPIIKRTLEEIPPQTSLIIDLSPADFIDQDVIEVIQEFLSHAHLKEILVEVKLSFHASPSLQAQMLPYLRKTETL
jgi:MFS superfamily sulfate permease-like transporter